MIVSGYQRIGKSTLANRDLRFVDLESSSFYIDGKRQKDWYKAYCQVAEHLSKQGYIVLVSCHEEVRKFLETSSETVICCAPSLQLEDLWLSKLKARYNSTGLDKDYRALTFAVNTYTDSIMNIQKGGLPVLWINTINYDLGNLILGAL